MRSLCLLLLLAATTAGADDWTPLLDADLTKWEVHTGVPHTTVVVPGVTDNLTKEDVRRGTPIGVGDPLKIYSTQEIDGELVMNVTGQVYAGLTSLDEYDNYHLSLEYRWGDKKWEPRLRAKRDSGLLLHCVGNHGSFWNVWMSSLECQVQEGDTGDFIPLAGPRADVRSEQRGGRGRPFWNPEAPVSSKGGQVAHGRSKENPHGEWNTVEVYTVGDRMAFVVNGTPNMVLLNTRFKDKPLTRGKIQIQSEAAEIQYRRVKIRSITEFPESLKELTALPAEESQQLQKAG